MTPINDKFNPTEQELREKKKHSKEKIDIEIKEKFLQYLKLIYSDLCAKDNGLSIKSFGQYTFQKV